MANVRVSSHTNVRFTGNKKIVSVYFQTPVFLPDTEQEAVERYEMCDNDPLRLTIDYYKGSTLVFVVVIPRSNISCITLEPIRRV